MSLSVYDHPQFDAAENLRRVMATEVAKDFVVLNEYGDKSKILCEENGPRFEGFPVYHATQLLHHEPDAPLHGFCYVVFDGPKEFAGPVGLDIQSENLIRQVYSGANERNKPRLMSKLWEDAVVFSRMVHGMWGLVG